MAGPIYSYPLTNAPDDYARLLIQPTGITTPYQSVTIQYFRADPTGPTVARPASPIAGQRYFDTDLGQPVWYSGSAWVNAAGAAV